MNLREFIHGPAVTCSPDTSIAEGAAEMVRHNPRSVVVLEPEEDRDALALDEDEDLPDEITDETEVALDEIIRRQFEPATGGWSTPDLAAREDEGWMARPTGTIIAVRRDEFVCQRCHLIKHETQLADPIGHVCRDCEA